MLQIIDVHKSFGGRPVLRDLTLDVSEGEIIALLGASGSGKSTLLRLIAGLDAPDRGDVRLRGASLLTVPVHARGFGLMFQDFALFPHLNVLRNVAFGLRMRGVPIREADAQAALALARVGLADFALRDTAGLSGGEKQRVALARSLAPQPSLLMLDEPLASLDAALRDRLVEELRAIIRSAGLTAIYVTHDQREAFSIADRLGVLHEGRIDQLDTPRALYQRPASAVTARFLGLNDIYPAVRLAASGLHVPTANGDVLIHPDGVTLADTGLPARITVARFAGAITELEARAEDGLSLHFSVASADAPPPGAAVHLRIALSALQPLTAPPAAR